MKRNRKELTKISLATLAMLAIGGSIPISSNDVQARNKAHVHHVIKKHVNHKRHVRLTNRNRTNLNNRNRVNNKIKNQRNNKKNHNKRHQRKNKFIMASNDHLLRGQINDVNKAIKKDSKKKQTNKVSALSKEKFNLEQEIKRLNKNDSYLAHSPKAKRNYQWLAQNGLLSYDKLYNKNKMYHLGFVNGASVKGTDSTIINKLSRNKTYEKGWLVGYASKITSDRSYPKAKTYYKAFKAYNHGSIYARHNNLNKVYLEISNVWGQYDI